MAQPTPDGALLKQFECKICDSLREKVTLTCCNMTICTACIARITPKTKKHPKNKSFDIKCPFGCQKCVVPPEGLPPARDLNDLMRFVLYRPTNGNGSNSGSNGVRAAIPDNSTTSSQARESSGGDEHVDLARTDSTSTTSSGFSSYNGQQKNTSSNGKSGRLFGGGSEIGRGFPSLEDFPDTEDENDGEEGFDREDTASDDEGGGDEEYVDAQKKRKRSPNGSTGNSRSPSSENKRSASNNATATTTATTVTRTAASSRRSSAFDDSDDDDTSSAPIRRVVLGGTLGALPGEMQRWPISTGGRKAGNDYDDDDEDDDEFHTIHTRSKNNDKKHRLLRELEDGEPVPCIENEKMSRVELERMKVWEEHYFQLVHYGDVHNSYLVPKDYKVRTDDGRVLALGEWTVNQRSRMKGGRLTVEKMEYMNELFLTGRPFLPPSRTEQRLMQQEERQATKAKAKAQKAAAATAAATAATANKTGSSSRISNPSVGRMVQASKKFFSPLTRRSRPDGVKRDPDGSSSNSDDDEEGEEEGEDEEEREDKQEKGSASSMIGLCVEKELFSGLKRPSSARNSSSSTGGGTRGGGTTAATSKTSSSKTRAGAAAAASPAAEIPPPAPGNLEKGSIILYQYNDETGRARIRFGVITQDVLPSKSGVPSFQHMKVPCVWVIPKIADNLPNSFYHLDKKTHMETTVENVHLYEIVFKKDQINKKRRRLSEKSKHELTEFLNKNPSLTHEETFDF